MHGITSMPNVIEALKIYTNSGGDIKNVPIGRFVYISQSNESAKRVVANHLKTNR